jgi:hypothetical protein
METVENLIEFAKSKFRKEWRCKKTHKPEMLKSNISNGSKNTLVTTWSGLGVSLRQGRAGWQATTW